MEVNFASGVGLSDLQHAARSEARRIITESKGDNVRQMEMILERLEGPGLISGKESGALLRMYQISHDAAADKADAQETYFECRRQLDSMLADSGSSPIAL